MLIRSGCPQGSTCGTIAGYCSRVTTRTSTKVRTTSHEDLPTEPSYEDLPTETSYGDLPAEPPYENLPTETSSASLPSVSLPPATETSESARNLSRQLCLAVLTAALLLAVIYY